MNAELLVVIIATALLSSAITLGTVWLVFQYIVKPRYEAEVKPRLEAQLDTQLEVLREKVKQGVIDAGVELLPRFREEVRAGFEDAAKGVVPAFRQEAEASFKETLKAMLKGEQVVNKAAQTAAKTGASILGTGLDVLRSSPFKPGK